MVELAFYSNSVHLPLLHQWMGARGAYLPREEEMPALGFVSYVDGRAVAMAFLRRVEGGYGQLDGLVTDPSAPGEYRHLGIDRAVEQVLISAKDLGIPQLIAFSNDKSTLERSVKHGFIPLPRALIAVDLSTGDNS